MSEVESITSTRPSVAQTNTTQTETNLANTTHASKAPLINFQKITHLDAAKSNIKKIIFDENEITKSVVSSLVQKKQLVDEKIIFQIKDLVKINNNSFSDKTQFVNFVMNEILYPKKEISSLDSINTNVEILFSYNKKPKRSDVSSFVKYFRNRLKGIKNILSARPELAIATSINRILQKEGREEVATIGMISEISETKNGNKMLTIEDETGQIKILLKKDKQSLKEISGDLVLDDIIGVVGNCGDKIIFANSLVIPEVPHTKEYKKSTDEVYACFLSDVHIGSKQFLKESFEKFLKWIRGEAGDEKQKELASKIKYVFVVGDLVDGVGIYPGQEKDLDIKDIHEQYRSFFNYFDKIPKDKKIIITLGNHDAERLSEPQPALSLKYRLGADFSNFYFVSNPAYVRIHRSENFEGFTCLLYHGYSFDYYVANVNSIRNNGGYDRADLIMKFLLQRRHLAPSYTSTLYNIDEDEDTLIIKDLPDFFATGHIHKTAVSNYKNITLISGSTWQDMTDFQAKLGHHPEPCRVPIVNLSTRDVKILKFT